MGIMSALARVTSLLVLAATYVVLSPECGSARSTKVRLPRTGR